MKALFINGSPRKNGNTAQLLKRAMDGASEAGAEVELVNLYDRSLNYKPSAHTPEGRGGRRAGVRIAQLLWLSICSPSCLYGTNGVSRSQLFRLLQTRCVEAHLFGHHLYDELPQRRGVSSDELPHPYGHCCQSTRHVWPHGDTLFLRYLSVPELRPLRCCHVQRGAQGRGTR